jgi:hypothetical protein
MNRRLELIECVSLMTAKKEKEGAPPKPFLSRSPDYRQIYVTGAIGSTTPIDYRLTFYTHEEQWPEKPKQITNVPISQVMKVTLIMSRSLMKNLSDMLTRQLEEKGKPPEQQKAV